MDIKLFDTEEEVNTYLGIEMNVDADLSWVQPQNRKALIAVNKLFNVHEAHCKANGFIADWGNNKQLKYNVLKYIQVDKNKQSGFGLSGTYYDGWHTLSSVGSRLCVGTTEEMYHIGDKFNYLYEDLFLIEK